MCADYYHPHGARNVNRSYGHSVILRGGDGDVGAGRGVHDSENVNALPVSGPPHSHSQAPGGSRDFSSAARGDRGRGGGRGGDGRWVGDAIRHGNHPRETPPHPHHSFHDDRVNVSDISARSTGTHSASTSASHVPGLAHYQSERDPRMKRYERDGDGAQNRSSSSTYVVKPTYDYNHDHRSSSMVSKSDSLSEDARKRKSESPHHQDVRLNVSVNQSHQSQQGQGQTASVSSSTLTLSSSSSSLPMPLYGHGVPPVSKRPRVDDGDGGGRGAGRGRRKGDRVDHTIALRGQSVLGKIAEKQAVSSSSSGGGGATGAGVGQVPLPMMYQNQNQGGIPPQQRNTGRNVNVNMYKGRPSTVDCQFWLKGACKRGDQCTFSHAKPDPRSQAPCKYLMGAGRCKNESCAYNHDTKSIPCKFCLLPNTVCYSGANCRFSHAPMDKDEAYEWIGRLFDAQRHAREEKAAALGIDEMEMVSRTIQSAARDSSGVGDGEGEGVSVGEVGKANVKAVLEVDDLSTVVEESPFSVGAPVIL